MQRSYFFAAVAIMSILTILLRALPFIIFSKNNTPKTIEYLGKVLPYSIMAMLVIYCLKNVNVWAGSHGLPEILAILFVVFLEKIKGNALISVFLGTAFYMFLVQVIF